MIGECPLPTHCEHWLIRATTLHEIFAFDDSFASGPRRLRDCADYPVVLPNRDTGGRQLLERFLARSSIRMPAMVESNSFEFLRGCLLDRQSISFQMAIGAPTDDRDFVAREIEDRGFPRGELVLASLRGRQLPVIAYAFAEFLRKRLAQTRTD